MSTRIVFSGLFGFVNNDSIKAVIAAVMEAVAPAPAHLLERLLALQLAVTVPGGLGALASQFTEIAISETAFALHDDRCLRVS